MKLALIPVQLGNGVVVLHSPAEYARLIRGVDLEAAQAMRAPLEDDDAPRPQA